MVGTLTQRCELLLMILMMMTMTKSMKMTIMMINPGKPCQAREVAGIEEKPPVP